MCRFRFLCSSITITPEGRRVIIRAVKRRHLVIDGYNVLHQWKETATLMRKNAVDAARRCLLDEARIIHDAEDMRTTIVYDGRGTKMEVLEDEASPMLAWVYSPAGVSADVIIEQLAMKADKKNEVTIVSMDSLIASSIRASGAFLISPDDFLSWAKRCRRTMVGHMSRQKNPAKGLNTGLWDDL